MGVARYLYLFSFLTLSNFVYPKENKVAEVLSLIKILEFEEARAVSFSSKQNKLSKGLHYLIALVELNTYHKNNKNLIKPYQTSDQLEIKGLTDLIKGYEALWVKNNRILALNHFSSSLDIAEEEGHNEIAKAALAGIFRVKKAGYSLPENDYKDYLEDFKQLISDEADQFWFHLYSIMLYDMTVRYAEELALSDVEFYSQELSALERNRFFRNSRLRFFVLKERGDNLLDVNASEALSNYQEAEELLDSNKYFDIYRFRIKVDKALALSKMGKPAAAADTLKKNIHLLEIGNEMTNRLNYSFFLSEFYRDLKSSDSAYIHLKELFNLRLASNHAQINERVSALEVELDTEKKDKLILKEQHRARTNLNFFITSILLALIGAVIAILLQEEHLQKTSIGRARGSFKTATSR